MPGMRSVKQQQKAASKKSTSSKQKTIKFKKNKPRMMVMMKLLEYGRLQASGLIPETLGFTDYATSDDGLLTLDAHLDTLVIPVRFLN